jgi:hypothetical protein
MTAFGHGRAVASWSFCPWCGHRLYQHNAEGCLHVEVVLRECTDEHCQADVIVTGEGGTHAHETPEQCDCKHGNPLLKEE